MSHVSQKLSSSIQGALAGGGDPATSPLYVFGPFLKLIVAAGAASVTFGASIWLAVLTVVTVSAMYRRVMFWVADGSGGSGLAEEEFGPWAVKVNAAITVVEYTLTFLVSIAALVTFMADRFPILDERVAGVPLRTGVAVVLSVITAFLVNRGPRVAARIFGPATAAILVLLWVLIGATVYQRGLHLPSLHPAAFSGRYLNVTLGGYARILALMTGIEIFANLVAAYEGPARERSRKAFGSLVIIMGTTSLTMLIVGPAIHDLADPTDSRVSVFTQTMDKLLPAPIAYLGTLTGIAVLLSAAAASAQGLQNLALGLRYRHYIPAALGQRNRFDVAAMPVWLQVAICACCFVAFGTAEETYLALYAAGVFVLLSLTGWAAVKRLLRGDRSLQGIVVAAGTTLAALLTSAATLIIFEERFREGAWSYFLLIPVLYLIFGRYRRKLGAPSSVEDRLGALTSASYLPSEPHLISFDNILMPLDQSPSAERVLAVALTLARTYGSSFTLLTVVTPERSSSSEIDAREYLSGLADLLADGGRTVKTEVVRGNAPKEIGAMARNGVIDAVVMSTGGQSKWQHWLTSNVTSQVIYQTTPPLILVRPTDDWRSTRTTFTRLIVALDGSPIAEQVLPFVRVIASKFRSQVLLLYAREGSESDDYALAVERYLDVVAKDLGARGVATKVVIDDSASPAAFIVGSAESERADLIMMVTHGRGGVARQGYVKVGSVADGVLQTTPCPVFLVSAVAPPEIATPTSIAAHAAHPMEGTG
jgi:nucleotide-binding universal stress UspA family protein